MKLLIASDIHGSLFYCDLMLKAFEYEKADKLLLLGDILYHGPRNDLPKDYNPKAVIEKLNSMSDKILCVRGNCDTEVDQMVLQFPVMADYGFLYVDGTEIYATHGHKYGEHNPPACIKNAVLLGGHTHVPKCQEYDGYAYINPGSVSIPKENSPHSYIVLEDNIFTWKDLETKEKYMDFSL